MSKYDAIINLPRPKSQYDPMSIANRAAQFAPFAALTGHEEAIHETARLTDKRIELAPSAKEEIGRKLQMLADIIDTQPEITVTYFVPDAYKEGGSYQTTTGKLRKMDDYGQYLVMDEGIKISFSRLTYLKFQ